MPMEYVPGCESWLRRILIGYDPRELAKLNHRMDAASKGTLM